MCDTYAMWPYVTSKLGERACLSCDSCEASGSGDCGGWRHQWWIRGSSKSHPGQAGGWPRRSCGSDFGHQNHRFDADLWCCAHALERFLAHVLTVFGYFLNASICFNDLLMSKEWMILCVSGFKTLIIFKNYCISNHSNGFRISVIYMFVHMYPYVLFGLSQNRMMEKMTAPKLVNKP